MLDPITNLYYHRLKRIGRPQTLRFLTFSCHHNLPLFSNHKIKDLFASRLAWCWRKRRFHLEAWVIMPTHIHLLLAPFGNVTVRTILHDLKGPFGRAVIDRWRTLDAKILTKLVTTDGTLRFWQAGGGYDRVTSSERDEKVQYIHMNPVEAGLVRAPEDWPWSSSRWYRGDHSGPVQLGRHTDNP